MAVFLSFSVAGLPLHAEEEGIRATGAGIRKVMNVSLWGHHYPRLAPVYFRGVCRGNIRNDTWTIDLISINGCMLPAPLAVALGKRHSGFKPEEGEKCSGIIPVLIPPGAQEKPGQWKDAGIPPLVVLQDDAETLPFLQDSVLEYYHYQANRSFHQASSILQQMTDEKNALILEKKWAFEAVDGIFWILMEGSMPLDARMAYVKRYPAVLEQSRQLSEDYQKALELLQNKPWSMKLNIMPPLPSSDELPKPVPGIEKNGVPGTGWNSPLPAFMTEESLSGMDNVLCAAGRH